MRRVIVLLLALANAYSWGIRGHNAVNRSPSNPSPPMGPSS